MDNELKQLLREGLNLANKTEELGLKDEKEEKVDTSLKDISEYIISEDGSFEIDISPDKLKVFLSVYPPVGKGKPVYLENIKQYLSRKQVSYGIQWEKINSLLELCEKEKKIIKKKIIAEGIPAFNGKPEEYIYHFEEKYNNDEEISENERIDYRKTNKIKSVKSGEKIITVIPGEPPLEGVDVTGTRIMPLPVQHENLKPALNIRYNEEELAFYSEVEGRVNIDSNNNVSVYPELIIDGNFDLNIGNIDFDGSLIIHGNINEGFDIAVRGDIHVDGNIYSSNIRCDGSITVLKGIITKEKFSIHAGKNITAKFIENSTVSCENDIYVSKAIIRSTVIAGNKIIASGEKGQIVASDVYAFNGIECREAGSPMGTATKLNAGIDFRKINEYNEKLEKLEEYREMNSKIAGYLQKTLEAYPNPALMETEVKKMLKILSSKNRIILEEIEKLKNELIELETRIYNFNNLPYIKIIKDVFPGTTINIGKAKMFIDKKSTAQRLIWDRTLNKIKTSAVLKKYVNYLSNITYL